MAIDYQRLKNWPVPEVTQRYGARETILYALGVGLGGNPQSPEELRFVFERGLHALPTMATILAYPGFWLRDPGTGVDWRRVLHGEQSVVIHHPLAPVGTLTGRTTIEEIVDKGRGKNALIHARRDLIDSSSGVLVASLGSVTVCRGEGGFGGPPGARSEPHRLPERDPDLACDLPTLPQAALIYRLSGDDNPLHADPAVAEAAGFRQPILHGLCTFGIAGHALLRTVCGYEPQRLRRIHARFSSPVFPGETVRTEIWREEEGRIGFRCRVVQRGTVAIDNGLAEIRN